MWDTTKLTVELREIVESGVDIWGFDYPSYYTGAAKREFERKVIDHFYFRQIGQETVGRWLHQFRTRVREIMPYYIQRYKSVEIMEKIEDPFESYNLTEEYTQKRVGKGDSTVKTSSTSSSDADTDKTTETDETLTNHNEKRFSNTPQGSIDNLDKYLTEATIDDGKSTNKNKTTEKGSANTSASIDGSSETSSNDTENITHTLTRKGNIGVATLAQEMNSFRTSFLNVDMEVINELNDLFLLVY